MRVNSYDYSGYRQRFLEEFEKLVSSTKFICPKQTIDDVFNFIDFCDELNNKGMFKSPIKLKDMEFSKYNVRHGYVNSIIGRLAEIISMTYTNTKYGNIRDVFDDKIDNVVRGIDYFYLHENTEVSVQVKTGRFKGSILHLEQDWLKSQANVLHIVDIDDRTIIEFKYNDFRELLNTQKTIDINKKGNFLEISVLGMY
jgi:hypothetical protein